MIQNTFFIITNQQESFREIQSAFEFSQQFSYLDSSTDEKKIEELLSESQSSYLIVDVRDQNPHSLELLKKLCEPWDCHTLLPTAPSFDWSLIPLTIKPIENFTIKGFQEQFNIPDKKNLLVVDDEQEFLEIIQDDYATFCNISTTHEPSQIPSLIKENSINHFICDIIMRKNGIEIFKELEGFIKENNIKFAFISGADDDKTFWKDLPLEIRFFEKPIDVNDVFNWLYPP